jgi:N-dimethylarginine dimethylaminohydrolase
MNQIFPVLKAIPSGRCCNDGDPITPLSAIANPNTFAKVMQELVFELVFVEIGEQGAYKFSASLLRLERSRIMARAISISTATKITTIAIFTATSKNPTRAIS